MFKRGSAGLWSEGRHAERCDLTLLLPTSHPSYHLSTRQSIHPTTFCRQTQAKPSRQDRETVPPLSRLRVHSRQSRVNNVRLLAVGVVTSEMAVSRALARPEQGRKACKQPILPLTGCNPAPYSNGPKIVRDPAIVPTCLEASQTTRRDCAC